MSLIKKIVLAFLILAVVFAGVFSVVPLQTAQQSDTCYGEGYGERLSLVRGDSMSEALEATTPCAGAVRFELYVF